MVTPDENNPYYALPGQGPYATEIGSALITMVEPNEGHDHAYNRWYEDEHFYSGAMAMPWMFAGRRWVATKDLQDLRYPEDSVIAQPVTTGCYITTYWITGGRYEDHMQWTMASNRRLLPDGRIYLDRTHIFTAFQEYHGNVRREPLSKEPGKTRPEDFQALDHPYAGLVVEVIDAADGVSREDLLAWIKEEHLPKVVAGSAVEQALVFTPFPLPEKKMDYVQDVPGGDKRTTILHFLQDDPRSVWDATFAGLGAAVAESGKGKVVFCAPFIPTIPGTDTYQDQLR